MILCCTLVSIHKQMSSFPLHLLKDYLPSVEQRFGDLLYGIYIFVQYFNIISIDQELTGSIQF